MPALNFQKQFIGAIERGEKSQTIRATRKRPIKFGDTLYLYTGMRTNVCRLIRAVRCRQTSAVAISENAQLKIDGRTQQPGERERFARADGFEDYAQMIAWFEKTHGLPFVGDLIVWSQS